MNVLERLAARSELQGDCLVWLGYRDKDGYGASWAHGKRALVHRAAWVERHGPIPVDTPFVLHRCDNPPCWADEHLFLGTNEDNIHDMLAKGRQGRQIKTHCPRGHEYTPKNTRVYGGARFCRACENERSIKRRAAKRLAGVS